MGFFDFHAHPGHLYVLATLLPLAAFVVLFLGGRRWGKLGGYIATGAIGAAFVLSVVGFVMHLSAAGHEAPGHTEHGEAGHSHASSAHAEHEPWAGSINWAVIRLEAESNAGIALKLGYYIDGLAAVMFLMISLVSTLIHIYSMGYMAEEKQETVEDHQAHVTRRGRYARFFMFLSLFCFSMLNLVLADNLFQVFISWELVGICSYLLIGFYYERRSASDAANKAFITNRIGDAGFIIGLLIIWTYAGTFDMQSIFRTFRSPEKDAHKADMAQAHEIVRVNPETVTRSGEPWLQLDANGSQVILFSGHPHYPEKGKGGTPEAGRFFYAPYNPESKGHFRGYETMPYWLLVLAGIGIFMGCVGKSAQFPLQVWLPDAMEGPTPVSALIHAATMVAAGVYLVGRVYPLFAPEVLLIIAYTGGITLFVAATIAIVQTDIKKVLAYSTVSQLGFMMLALGVGGWVAGLFHLITHAFFKALLFLCSGSVIHGCHHEQEMTKMGGLYPKMKITAITMLIGVLTIAGTPLLSGWYSKDSILVSALSFVSLNPKHFLLFLLPLLTAGITAFYMFRLWFMTFTGEPRDQHVHEHAHESPWVMTVPLIVLAFFSVVVSWGNNPFNVQGSALEEHIHHDQPKSVTRETGLSIKHVAAQAATTESGGNFFIQTSWLHPFHNRLGLGPHDLAGVLALLSAALGVALAFVIYYWGFLDPADAQEQFPRVHDFLWHKWYFDEFYSSALVRPALVVSQWCRGFDLKVIDWIVDHLAWLAVKISSWDGKFDLGIIDGLVNLTAQVVYAVGSWLRVFQTGLIRNYILFLALAAVAIFAVLSYVIALTG